MNILNKKNTSVFVILTVVILSVGLGVVLNSQDRERKPDISTNQKAVVEENKDTFSYQGRDGVSALDLLKESTVIEEEQKGFVTSINGRKADPKNREFWALYVNGEQAQVGAESFITKNSDSIEWRIETY